MNFQLAELEMPSLKLFNEGKADFAVVRVNLLDKSENYSTIPFCSDEMFAICSPSHPFASRKEVPLEEIVLEKLVLHKNAVSEVNLLLKKCLPHFEYLTPAVSSTTNPTLYEYVAMGWGSLWRTISYINSMDPDNTLVRVPVKEKPCMQLGMLVRYGALSASCVELMSYITSNLEYLREDRNKQ